MKKVLKFFSFIGGTLIFFAIILSHCGGAREVVLEATTDSYLQTAKEIEVTIPDWNRKTTISNIVENFLRVETGADTLKESDIEWKLLGKLDGNAKVYVATVKGSKDQPSVTIRVYKNGDFFEVKPFEMEFKTNDGEILNFFNAVPIYTTGWD